MADVSDCNCNTAAVSMDEVMVSVDIQAGRRRGRVLHRVPEYMRENKKHIYDPVVLSLGPYHYGRTQQFHLAEKVKDKVVDIVCGDTDRGFLLSKIRERVEEIRHYFYGSGAEECCYSEEELSEMMLRDACFVLCYIEMARSPNDDEDFGSILLLGLGMSGTLAVRRDLLMLENQIPLWFIKLVFSLTQDDGDKFRTLLCNYLTFNVFGERRVTRLPWEYDGEEEPLHLLEALILTSLAEDPSRKRSFRQCESSVSVSRSTRKGSKCASESASSPFGSMTYLKAKGIRFGPSSYCPKHISFIYSKLHIPKFIVNNNTQVFYSNAIAFELSPGTPTDFTITSYFMFMKTLIGEAKDAKELREMGILIYNWLGSDEDVVRVFQGVDTQGFFNQDLFLDVKTSIEEHCNNRAKMWEAKLKTTYFVSPWTAITIVQTIIILILTLIQTFYAINH